MGILQEWQVWFDVTSFLEPFDGVCRQSDRIHRYRPFAEKHVGKSRHKDGLTPRAGILCPAKTGKQVPRLFVLHEFCCFL